MRPVVRNRQIQKEIRIAGSKSYANRALIQASLKKHECIIKNVPQARDTLNLRRCLQEIGLKIIEQGDQLKVVNSFPLCETPSEKPIKLHTGDGGTTNRFLVSLLTLGKNEYHLYPAGQMITRPMREFQKYLEGFEVKEDHFRICGSRGIHNKKFSCIDLSRTTQIASSLMLVHGIAISPDDVRPSPYLRMTEEVVRNFDQEYYIRADWSSAAFPLAFAALAGEVRIKNITTIDSNQGDSQILKVLEQIGAKCELSSTGLVVKKHLKRPFHWDCRHCPDIFPVLTFLAAHLGGESTLCGLGNLKYKESDRLAECVHLLKIFGVSHRQEGDFLTIQGKPSDNRERSIVTARDHRLVMTAYLYLRLNGGGQLGHSEEVAKSFPLFFEMI